MTTMLLIPTKKDKSTSNIELRLEYLKQRDNPDELMFALYKYTLGYRKFAELVVSQIEPEKHVKFQLDKVEEGSIKLKNVIGLGNELVEFISEQICALVTDNSDKPEDIEAKAEKLELAIEHQLESSGTRIEPFIDRITLAEICMSFSDGGTELRSGEYLELNTNAESETSNVLRFDRSFRSSVKPTDMKKTDITKYNGPDKLIAERTCNVGDSSWYFKSLTTSRRFYAKITDSEWLKRYQSGLMPTVRANDVMEVNLKCDAIKTSNGSVKITNASITKVNAIQHIKQEQEEMF